MLKSYMLYKTIWSKHELMIRNQSDILVAIIAIIGLVLTPTLYSSSSTVKATPSSEGQTSSTIPTVLALLQNGNTQNHFIIDKSQFKKAPEFTGITGFVNTPAPIKLADLKGKVVLVHFWTYTCINCIHTIPYLNDWYQKYSNKGLVIVSIHRPEFEFEKNIDNVKAAVQQYQIKYPVLQDNNYGTWNAYGNTY